MQIWNSNRKMVSYTLINKSNSCSNGWGLRPAQQINEVFTLHRSTVGGEAEGETPESPSGDKCFLRYRKKWVYWKMWSLFEKYEKYHKLQIILLNAWSDLLTVSAT